MRITRTLTAAAAAVTIAALTTAAAVPAAAAPAREIARGTTSITVSPAALGILTATQITPGVLNPGTATGATFMFPITGTPKGEVVKHTGGVTLTKGGTTLTLTNFWIDLTTGTVSGVVNDSTRLDLFDLDGLDLVINDTTSGALVALAGLNVPDDYLTGTVFGTAALDLRR